MHAGVHNPSARSMPACASNHGGGMRAREQVRPGLGHCAVSSAPHGINKKKETHESKTGVLQLDEGIVELNIIYCVPLRGFCRGVLYSITLYIDYSKSFLR